MYWANPVSYAFQGLASNEFWGREYSCQQSELVPPTSVANFNLPYPEGFEGNQACPVTSGTDYIVNDYGIFDMEWLKWIMAVCVIGWWVIFTGVTYIGLRFVRHSPPKKPRMKNVEVHRRGGLRDEAVQHQGGQGPPHPLPRQPCPRSQPTSGQEDGQLRETSRKRR